MLSKVILVVLLVIGGAYYVLSTSPPPRFPQFAEYAISGVGTFDIPQWSSDSRYLAYLDTSNALSLSVYDTETKSTQTLVSSVNIDTAHFSWKPDGTLTYLMRRSDLSGLPYPRISELHQIDLSGSNDEIIAANLSGAGDFAWFRDGERAAILLTDPASNTYFNDVYLLDTVTNTATILVKAQELGFQYIASLTLTPYENSLLIYGVYEDVGIPTQLVLYNLETQNVTERITPTHLIPSGGMPYPEPSILDSTNATWVGGERWYLAPVNTPGGDCYNYALFFFNLFDQSDSFCIPTSRGIVAYPAISPDLTKISYVTVVGPGHAYLMLGTVPADLLQKLELHVNNSN